MIPAVTQTLCNQASVPFIRFNPLALLSKHGCRCKDDALDPGACELMIKGITEAASLVTAFNRIIIVEPEFHLERFYKANDLFIVRSNLYLSENPVFCSDCWLHCA
jgi:hypothetical protein